MRFNSKSDLPTRTTFENSSPEGLRIPTVAPILSRRDYHRIVAELIG